MVVVLLAMTFAGVSGPRSAWAQPVLTLSNPTAETAPIAGTAAAMPATLPVAASAADPASLAAATSGPVAAAPSTTPTATTTPITTTPTPSSGANATCRSFSTVDSAPAASQIATSAVTLPAYLPAPSKASISGMRIVHPNANALRIALVRVPASPAVNATAANTTAAAEDATSMPVTMLIKDVKLPLPAAGNATEVVIPMELQVPPAAGAWVLVASDLGATAATRTIDIQAWTLTM